MQYITRSVPSVCNVLLALVAMLAPTSVLHAQTYSNLPNDTIKITGMMEDLETLSIRQLNTSADTIQLQWEKVSESVPLAWDASVCDNAFCYTSLLDGGAMNPIAPLDYGFLLLHITPRVEFGTAVIRYAVWDIANPIRKDTLTYILTVGAATSVDDVRDQPASHLFPNPATNNINLTSMFGSGFQFFITDVSGRVIERGVSTSISHSLNIEHIPNGAYRVAFVSDKNVVTFSTFLVIR